MLSRQCQSLPTELVTGRKHQALSVCSTIGTSFPVTNLEFTHVKATRNTLACLLDSARHSH